VQSRSRHPYSHKSGKKKMNKSRLRILSEHLKNEKSYWLQKFSGELARSGLPPDFTRNESAVERTKVFEFCVETDTGNRLNEIAARNEVLLFAVLVTALKLCLHKYTGNEDVIVGTAIHQRHPEDAALNKVLALRDSVCGTKTARQLLDEVRRTLIEAYSHQKYPFEQLVELLDPPAPGRAPLFDVAISLDSINDGEHLCGLRHDVALNFSRSGEHFIGSIEYVERLFNAATLELFANHYKRALLEILRHPNEEIRRLDILLPEERDRLVNGFNNSSAEHLRHQTIHLLFEEQVEKSPDRVALVAANQSLTYRQLNERANQVAHYLKAKGVGPEVPVAIFMDRSVELLIGILATLKAGGAYVPLDPADPQERLSLTLADTAAPVLLAQERLRERLPAYAGQLLFWETEPDAFARQPTENLPGEAQPDNLAYIIYTSGSTGTPKGVCVEHRAVARLVKQNDYVDFGAAETFLMLAPVSFDASTFEIWGSLLNGARLVVMPAGTPSLSELGKALRKHRVTTLFLTSGLFHLMVDQQLDALKSVRQLLTGGDVLSVSHVQRFLQTARDSTLVAAYGPTENTTFTSCHPMKSGAVIANTVPLGRPIASTQVYLLNTDVQPVPLGAFGELYAGGDGLARGYWRQPALTAEKFVPHPFSDEAGARLYKTGDRARYVPDGTIEFGGREDQQVKIRGFRVELGEIEATLVAHQAVRECVVVAREAEGSDKLLIAYVVCEQQQGASSSELRNFLKARLPEYMVPQSIVSLDALPLTPNGKLNRHALPAPAPNRPASPLPRTDVERRIATVWREVLGVAEVGIDDNFFDVGGHSLLLVKMQYELQQILDEQVSLVDLFQYPTIHTLAAHLSQLDVAGHAPRANEEKSQVRRASAAPGERAVAIIGMAARFPGARNIDAFWENLKNGVESVSSFSEQPLAVADANTARGNGSVRVRAGAVLDEIELFDASFFGMTPREAETTDPQQRLSLESAFEALEHAGYNAETYSGRIGLYAGAGRSGYLARLEAIPELTQSIGELQLQLRNEREQLPLRVAYKLGFRGPSINVQTACSTSLVAVHLACQSLLNGECEMALAGGVWVKVDWRDGYVYQEGGIYSSDGHCCAFDSRAQGTVPGNGVGLVVLKRLEQALADGDTIHAVILGSAVNNDGSTKVGYTAPSVTGQAEVIICALAAAGVDASSISFVETHGTGTPLGDQVEIGAMTQAFRRDTEEKGYCAIGSVKTNFGHLGQAAGIAGLIKTVLALKYKALPPSLNFTEPKPETNLADSPFYVNATLCDWDTNHLPRRAGVSSFGVGGTNAHLILEEAPPPPAPVQRGSSHLLTISARTSDALEAATERLRDHLKQNPELNIADVAYTCQTGRRAFRHRRMLVCSELADALTVLEKKDPKRIWQNAPERNDRPVAFMFPGLGDHYVNMAAELYETEPTFRAQVNLCCELLEPHLELDLRSLLYAQQRRSNGTGATVAPSTSTAGLDLRKMLRRAEPTDETFQQSIFSHAALFTVEYALAQLWMEWGVRPSAFVGYSTGEYVAACLAGVISLPDALFLVVERSRLMQALPRGAMLALSLPEDEVRAQIGAELSLAAANGPAGCVIAGGIDAVADLERHLAELGVPYRRLLTTHAFHSRMMEPIVEQFKSCVEKIKLNAPNVPLLSTATCEWLGEAETTDPNYWAHHLYLPVRFGDALKKLWGQDEFVLLEVGPGQTLSAHALQYAINARLSDPVALPSLRAVYNMQSDISFLLGTLGKVWLAGVQVDWQGIYSGKNYRRVPLPTYPFERQRYWIERPTYEPAVRSQHKLLDRQDLPQAFATTQSTQRERASDGEAIKARASLRNVYVAPANDTEQTISRIWWELLGLENLGVHDSFLEVGGDSLLAVQMLTRLRQVFEIELPLHVIFERPTVAAIAEAVSAATRENESLRLPPLHPAPRGERLPLSFAQQRLWFLHQLVPDDDSYNIFKSYNLSGPLNLAALERSLSEIIRRHEILHTSFPAIDGVPFCAIHEPRPLAIPIVDLSRWPEPELEILRLADDEISLPFNLLEGPMLRVKLFRRSEQDHALLIVMHHIVTDAWSLEIFAKELALLYEAFSQGKPSPLSALQLQYVDYAVWQRQQLSGTILTKQLEFWREQLAGAPFVLELLTDHPRLATQKNQCGVMRFTLSKQLTRGLKDISKTENATLFMTLLAAFGVLLSRYSGQNDFLIGVAVANRSQAEVEPLIGFFINTLLMRIDVRRNPKFTELLRRVREMALRAYAHQDVPFEKLVAEFAGERDASRTPLFQVVFNFGNVPHNELKLSGLTISPLSLEAQTAKFDLTLSLVETDQGLSGSFEYNANIFEAETIERMSGSFVTLLDGLFTDADRLISHLPLLSQPELQLLDMQNDTCTEYPKDKCIHELFEEQAARTPDAVAVAYAGERLTYGELNERANQLAHYLCSLGVGPEVRVGVLLERSPKLIIALLAILKAGGAYVPLDGAYPEHRLQYILANAEVSVLLIEERFLQLLSARPAHTVCLDRQHDQWRHERVENPASGALADNLAYVIYTSGSTGQPKGVSVTHRAIARLVYDMDYVQLTADDYVAQVFSATFDVASFEIWGALLHGVRLVGFDRDIMLSSRAFTEQLAQQHITGLILTTAVFNQLAREAPGAFSHLRYLMFGGEVADVRWVREVLKKGRPEKLINIYGPTENTIFSTWHEVREMREDETNVPIGRPLPNTQAYVLNDDQCLVPIGVPGELYLGGDGLARDYRGQPELTAEKFIPNPFSASGGERLYKTGDVCRYRPDGNIEFLGRIDRQVKMRGFRIELEEIEAVMMQHEAVIEAVAVIVNDENRDDKHIAAYVVWAEDYKARNHELRDYLKESLPEYMIPSSFTALQALPLTIIGKVDRGALPAPAPLTPASPLPYTDAEHQIAAVWREVLGLDEVGVHDNFFDIGGHSLLLFTVQIKLHEWFGHEVSLVDLFKCPTVHTLVEHINAKQIADTSEWQSASHAKTHSWHTAPMGSAMESIPAGTIVGSDDNNLGQTETEQFISQQLMIISGQLDQLYEGSQERRRQPFNSDSWHQSEKTINMGE